jgi:hypothetical protein
VLRSLRSTDSKKATTSPKEEEEETEAGILRNPVDLLDRLVSAALDL